MDTSVPATPGDLRVEHVSRAFGGREVLGDVSFDLGPGTVAALIGANGSGKTTLLRIVAGVLAPDSGRVDVAGAAPGRGRAGYVPGGDRMLNWRLSGLRNLEFFARIGGVPERSVRDRVRSAAGSVGAEHLLAKPVGQCSMGERRRLMMARAFVSAPPVVLLDEPFADLDEEGCEAIDRLTRGWADAGGVVLYAAPVDSGGPSADVVLHVHEGRVEASA